MSKITSNANIRVAWILDADLTDPDHPSAAELNAGLNLTDAIAWDGFEAGAEESDSNDDRALSDVGSAVSRGFANYAASLPFFYDSNPNDTNSPYNDAFDAFRTPLINGWLVVRVAVASSAAFAAGQRISVYKFQSGVPVTDNGDASTKFVVDMLPQGELYVQTIVDSALPLVALPATDSIAVGEYAAITVTLDGVDVTHSCDYSTANSAIVSVSELGAYGGVSVGGPITITVSHPSASASDTVAITVTA